MGSTTPPGERMRGRKALVIGAGSGIGHAIAGELVDEGARVVVADIDAASAEATAASIGATALVVDVADAESVRRCVEDAVGALGGLDAVCSTAGVLVAGTLEDTGDDAWARCLAVNLTGSFLVARAAAPHLRAAAPAALLLTSSTSGLVGSRGQSAYCAAKHGIVGLTRALADELAPHVRVNCLCPGWVDTPFNEPVWDHHGGRASAEPSFMAQVPARRQASANEIARAATFLLSPGASYLTGVALPVDGGLVATR